jgi:hypothetical protein
VNAALREHGSQRARDAVLSDPRGETPRK